MPFKVTTMKDQADSEQQDIWIADRRLWLTADKSRAVEDGDPTSAFLLIAPGQGMSRAQAEQLGVIPQSKEPEPEPVADLKEKEKPEDKQKAKPATKSRKPKK